jgi:hypothetical protein
MRWGSDVVIAGSMLLCTVPWPRTPAVAANRAAWATLGRWEKPFLTVFSDGDPIIRDWVGVFQRHVPGAAGMPHSTPHAGHFVQEDAGPDLALADRRADRGNWLGRSVDS